MQEQSSNADTVNRTTDPPYMASLKQRYPLARLCDDETLDNFRKIAHLHIHDFIQPTSLR